ncbi:MAG: SRPBCC domain-containing protein [Ignavibacterium sp.]|nr:MAG: SRPBCC domain-containing protein [Ignavibacterium sp.]
MNYESSIKVKTEKKSAFKAVASELNMWWGRVDSPVFKVGDEFTISFGKTKWRFKITEFSKYDRITWKCIEAEHFVDGFTDIKEEWLNTEVVWAFNKDSDDVEISMEHNGLTPELNCYDICESGWDYFVATSLKNYLETGKGTPRFE